MSSATRRQSLSATIHYIASGTRTSDIGLDMVEHHSITFTVNLVLDSQGVTHAQKTYTRSLYTETHRIVAN